MKRQDANVLGLLLSVLIGGCLFDQGPTLVDGESCEAHDECLSGHCTGGMCTGSTCDVDPDCEQGFTCAEPSTFVEVFSFGTAEGSCVPTCEVCPIDEPRWWCSGESCNYDDTPSVEAGGPYEAVVGEPVRLAGSAEPAPGREIESAQWYWYRGEQQVLGEGFEIDAVFEAPGSHTVHLEVHDNEHTPASSMANVSVCSPTEGPCSADRDCCEDSGNVCRFEADPYNGTCGPPPVCGDGVREGNEECDGGDTPPTDCTELGQFHPGPASCSDTCHLDTFACQRCGESFDDCSSDADCCEGWVCLYDACRSR